MSSLLGVLHDPPKLAVSPVCVEATTMPLPWSQIRGHRGCSE